MSVEEKAKANTQVIKEQIDRFDNKANILIAVVSIVFAISLSMVDVFYRLHTSQTQENNARYICLIVFACLYVVSFACEMSFLVAVIYPRKKTTANKSTLYYYDVCNMSTKTIVDKLEREDICVEVEQLKNNATICKKKHELIVCASWTLFPLFTFAIAMFLTAII